MDLSTTLSPLTIDPSYVPTTIAPFKDITSGSTNPPTCGDRTCSSDNPHVVWSATTQLFTVSFITGDVAGITTV